MLRAVTIAEVARLAGVSKTTVSRVLNGVGAVDPVTAARVNRIIAESGYVPSARSPALSARPTSGLRTDTLRPVSRDICVHVRN